MQSKVNVCPVPAHLLGDVLPLAAPRLVDGLEAGKMPLLEALARIGDGELTLWVVLEGDPPAVKAAFVSQIVQGFPPFVGLALLGGNGLKRFHGEIDKALQDYARDLGVGSIRFKGRIGYTRIFKGLRVLEILEGGEHLLERAVA